MKKNRNARKKARLYRNTGWLIGLLLSVCLLFAGCAGTDTSHGGSGDNVHVNQTQSTTSGSGAGADANSTSDAKSASVSDSADTPAAGTEDTTASTSGAGDASAADANGTASNSAAVSLQNLPVYSGTPYVAIDSNVPQFADGDYQTTSFETYSDLDGLGRCGVAYANIGKDLMPTQDRGAIGSVRPTGWQTVKYDNVDGKYLYNRCHLIGYQLSGENANKKNLITGTRYLNVDGMLPFENMVADYVKETGNHVLYRVTPVFTGDNLVADGVHMEAVSVEDKGDGVSFNVFVYNVQPGITIDYATGKSSLSTSEDTAAASESGAAGASAQDSQSAAGSSAAQPAATSADVAQQPEATPAAQPQPSEDTGASGETSGTYIINRNTGKFHKPTCSSVARMKEENKEEYTGDRSGLIAQGYEPCENCNP